MSNSNHSFKPKSLARDLVYIALFSALIAVSAFIQIPFVPVSFTLQTFFCILAGSLLGAKRGTISVAVYIALGLSGVPIFINGGGLSYVFQRSFGYLLGMLPAAFLSGLLLSKIKLYSSFTVKNYILISIILFACGLLVLACGFIYYAYVLTQTTPEQFYGLFKGFFLLYVPAEAVKSLACAILYLKLKKYIF